MWGPSVQFKQLVLKVHPVTPRIFRGRAEPHYSLKQQEKISPRVLFLSYLQFRQKPDSQKDRCVKWIQIMLKMIGLVYCRLVN